MVACFEVERALADPHHLDRGEKVSPHSGNVGLAEECSACWLDDDRVVIGASNEAEDPAEVQEAGDAARLLPRGLAVYDLAAGQCLRAVQLAEQPGTILPVGRHHVLSLYRDPKLIDLATGEVLHAWADLSSGLQSSSIIRNDDAKPPPMAFESAGSRFAIADRERIAVIELDLSALGSSAGTDATSGGV
jgi:hypothetical protein